MLKIRFMISGNGKFEIKKRLSKGILEVEIKILSDFSGFIPIADLAFTGKPDYSFVGGMFYTKDDEFDLDKKLDLNFPYTSYCKFRVPGIKKYGKFWKSLVYSKMPIVAVQSNNKLFAVEFEPVIKSSKGKEIVPFIAMKSKKGKVSVSFAIFGKFPIMRKKEIWMGFGKRREINYEFSGGEKIKLCFKLTDMNGSWNDFTIAYFRGRIKNEKLNYDSVKKNAGNVKTAFWRAWDDKLGAFAQLPWKNCPGFSLDNLTWGLTSYESVNMNYFRDYFMESGDMDYLYWSHRLEKIFTNPKIVRKPRFGRGIIWKELTGVSGRELLGVTYLYTGYAGYPGGQATIALNLMNYGLKERREELLKLGRSSLEYIVSTQNRDGSWPAAKRQIPEFPVRSSSYEKLKTTGGSAECVRALLLGWKFFGDKKFFYSAMHGLEFLKPSKGNACIGVNVLRDIGKDEIEGLSAVYAVNAFLDSYEMTGKKEFLSSALIWASHMLTWFYMWESEIVKLKGFFHPISQSITPRISPYESVLIVPLCARLFEKTKDVLWKNIALMEYGKISRYIEPDGGLCECYFPDWLDGISSIPMEQTFATAELLNASMAISKLCNISLKIKNKNQPRCIGKKIGYSKNNDFVEAFQNGKSIAKFDFKNFSIYIEKKRAELSLFNPYSKKNMIKESLRSRLAGGFAITNAPSDIYSIISGVKAPEKEIAARLCLYSKQKKIKWGAEIISEFPFRLRFFSESSLHRIEGVVKITRDSGKTRISFEPLEIRTLGCGVVCSQALFPVADSGINVMGEFDRILKLGKKKCFDISCQSNWTHHGIFRQNISMEA